jgi:hypothetical protein
VVLNGFAATSEDWDPSFIDRLASSNQLILLDNRGMVAPQTTDSHLILPNSPMMPRE